MSKPGPPSSRASWRGSSTPFRPLYDLVEPWIYFAPQWARDPSREFQTPRGNSLLSTECAAQFSSLAASRAVQFNMTISNRATDSGSNVRCLVITDLDVDAQLIAATSNRDRYRVRRNTGFRVRNFGSKLMKYRRTCRTPMHLEMQYYYMGYCYILMLQMFT